MGERTIPRFLAGLAILYFFIVPLFLFHSESTVHADEATGRIYGDGAALVTIVSLAWIAATAFHDIAALVKARTVEGTGGVDWTGLRIDITGDAVLLLEAVIGLAFLGSLVLGYPFRLFQ